MKQIITNKLTQTMLFVFLALLTLGITPALGYSFGLELWPNGRIPYKFDDGTLGPVAVHAIYLNNNQVNDQTKIEREMLSWEFAMTFRDPTGAWKQYIDFWHCGAPYEACPENHLVIRYNKLNANGTEAECNNMSDPVGMELRDRNDGNPDGITQLHFRRGTCPDETPLPLVITPEKRTNQDANTIRHELGHSLGLWHEFNRADADRWLVETPDLNGANFENKFNNTSERSALMPTVGNYDYDSLMHYSFDNVTDRKGNQFSRFNLDRDPGSGNVSERDISRVLQYYAYERYRGWGFFTSLSRESQQDPDAYPNPYLAQGVKAVGSPAIAYQSSGNYDIVTRGSDDHIYWKNNTATEWQSIACCFGSDPSVVSRASGRIDVVAISNTVSNRGEVQRIKYIDGTWYAPLTPRGGYPTGGIKPSTDGGYIGPAIASRGAGSLDVFVVRDDGRLAVTTLSNGNWEAWRTLGGNYNVTARPAAVALTADTVKLAINERGIYLYEGTLTFEPLATSFGLVYTANMADGTPPALAKRDSQSSPYRVFITNAQGRISHRFADDSIWRDIGGIPKPGTGPAAVIGPGRFSAYIVMNGEDAKGCDAGCARDPNYPNNLALDPVTGASLVPRPYGEFIRSSGLWLRYFE